MPGPGAAAGRGRPRAAHRRDPLDADAAARVPCVLGRDDPLGDPPAEPATDVYGLGVLPFEMVTGQPAARVRELTPESILERLDSDIRPSRMKCVALPLTVLQGALVKEATP